MKAIRNHVSGRLSDLDREVVHAVPPGGNWRDLPAAFNSRRIEQIRRSAAAGEGSRSTYYGRLRADRPSYTISTYFNRPGNGCFIHPSAPRLITVREAARLQGFRDSFVFEGRGRAPFIQVGNAVPPLMVYQLARILPKGGFVDLFAGAGGMSTGFQEAGHELLLAVDHDKACVQTLRSNGHAPDRAAQMDLSSASGIADAVARIRDRSSSLDLLVGGPPCQGFSTAGKNLTSDPRNRLVNAFLEVITEVLPTRVIMENVAALAFRRSRPVFDAILQRLEGLGYSTSTAILHAEGYGVPQLRRRLFVSASLEGVPEWPTPSFSILDPAQRSSQPRETSGSDRPALTVGDAIGDLPFEAANSPEVEMPYGKPPSSLFQQWARGEIDTDSLVDNPNAMAEMDLQLAV
ncbi:DNA cytosine methyltransferase [Thermoleophilia bacterium SCSIO 60948]|nr:DNA cytosine methyltransferase [Thermoleophilia bacterium SCSIO 60948]